MKTVNLELSKQLKEAGYPQKGEFYWIIPTNSDYKANPRNKRVLIHKDMLCHDESCGHKEIASPTADEILEQLPDFIMVHRENAGWYCEMRSEVNKKEDVGFFGDSLADAAAKLWLYLKQNNLLEVKG